MSTSNTLRRAAKLQEKIEQLRERLVGILDQARAEIASSPKDEYPTVLRRVGRPKMLKAGASTVREGARRGPRGFLLKADHRVKTIVPKHGGRRSPLAGQKRSASPSGPLAPAVVEVLQSKRKAMKVRDIFAELISNGYKFNSAEPKKNLAARIYRLEGVKQISAGLFGLA